MTRTPDEIKKGLECCAASYADCHKECPYKPDCDGSQILKDSLALIQQLEATVSENEKVVAELSGKIGQLEAERDAAVTDIRLAFTSYVGTCQTCKHVKDQVDCDNPLGCGHCGEEKCKCNSCDNDYSNWQWRGVQKEETT